MPAQGEYSAEPQLVPARMLNELVYCRRLFHLEWMDGCWVHNDDTIQGSVAHDATYRRSGRMPAPDEGEKPLTPIKVALSEPDLGMTAVIKQLDHEDGSSSPVDMKEGTGFGDGGMWPARPGVGSYPGGAAAYLETLLGVESAVKRPCFGQFHKLLSPRLEVAVEFQVHGRARRPLPDPFGVVLTGWGWNLFLGGHQPRYGRPTLNLAEEFRASWRTSSHCNVATTVKSARKVSCGISRGGADRGWVMLHHPGARTPSRNRAETPCSDIRCRIRGCWSFRHGCWRLPPRENCGFLHPINEGTIHGPTKISHPP